MIDAALLTPIFAGKLEELVMACARRRIVIRPFSGFRDVAEQARLWRSSRTIEEITAAIERLKSDGAPFLAGMLDSVGPQSGKKEVTKALPGLSWHQWGEACDCVVVENGAAVWDGPGYAVYREEAERLGLTQISWERVHVQLRAFASPLNIYPMAQIDRAMAERFGAGAPPVA